MRRTDRIIRGRVRHLRAKACRGHRHGQALVPVLFVLVILTSVAVTFAVAAHSELRASANFANRTARYYAARGALNYAMGALAATSNNGAMYGIVPPNPDVDANGWWQVGDAWVKLEVVDTGSRIDLNSVTAATLNGWPSFQNNTQTAGAGQSTGTSVPGAIVSWHTAPTASSSGTSSASAGGTNDTASTDPYASYYSGLSPAYQEKNAPYETVNELLLVQGMTPVMLYGTISGSAAMTEANGATTSSILSQGPVSTDSNGTSGAGGSSGASAGQATSTDFSSVYASSTIPMSELFTTLSREREIAVNGMPRVNINTAAATDLQNIGLTTAQANRLIQYRQSGGSGAAGGVTPGAGAGTTAGGVMAPGKSVGRTRQAATNAGVSGTSTGASKTGTGTGKTGTGATGTGTGASAAPVFTTIADLLGVPGFSSAIMQQIADNVAVDSNTYREHVVNVNTASQEVLAAVPGMDLTTLNAILTARSSGTVFQSLADVFALQGVSQAEFQAVIGGLTTKTSTYIVRVKVRMPGEQALFAFEGLVELTDNGPLVLQWREVPMTPGWSSWTAPPTLTQATGQSSNNSTTN